MRRGSTLTYLHGDHLGSASLATDASGAKITDSDTRYYPYGVTRPGLAGTGLPTDRRFTGQREETGLGCYDYGARPYAPALGRFLQADTLVPEPANPQSLNRYSYTLGNPLRYTDPSGHRCEEPELGDPPNVQFHDFSYSAGQDGVTAANSVELLGGQIVDTIGTILGLWNFGLDLVEIAAPPGVDQIPAWADLFIATESSAMSRLKVRVAGAPK